MSKSYVTDLTHFLNEKGSIPDSLPKPAKKLAENLGNIVACVTREPRPSPKTYVNCWGKLNKKRCAGKLNADLDFENFDIVWHCPECGDNGSISQWENSFWDCGHR